MGRRNPPPPITIPRNSSGTGWEGDQTAHRPLSSSATVFQDTEISLTSSGHEVPNNALSPAVRDRLDHDYVTWHDKYLQPLPLFRPELWTPTARNKETPLCQADEPPVQVGSTEYYAIAHDLQAKVYIPKGSSRKKGVVLSLHGGGFMDGGLHSDMPVCTRICKDAGCIVIVPNYRLVTDSPFPAAFKDIERTLAWVQNDAESTLGCTFSGIALLGNSSGGALVLWGMLKAIELNLDIQLLIFLVPWIRIKLDLSTKSWLENQDAPWTGPTKLLFFEQMVLSEMGLRERPEANLIQAILRMTDCTKIPRTHIVAAEVDALRDDGVTLAKVFKDKDVDVTLDVVKGVPHMFPSMCGILRKALVQRDIVIELIKETLGQSSVEAGEAEKLVV